MRQSIVFHVEVHRTHDLAAPMVKTFRYKRKELAIGSRDDNDLVLPHKSIADRHCIITALGGGEFYLVTMPESLTSVNGREISRFYDGDSILLGVFRLVFRTGDAKPEETAFLETIGQQPNDDETRAVYADWLEEQNRHPEARFLRDEGVEPGYIHGTIPWRRLVSKTPIEKCGFHFQFECPKKWDQLKPTDRPDQRFCWQCEKNVHYAASIPEARELAREGQCIAIDLGQVRSEGDLDPPDDDRTMLMGMIVAD
jgi:uncharacterized protein (TIGR02996 family)